MFVLMTLILIACGVPQGSTLGPALFIMYINDMCNVSSLMKSIVFADDTNFFYSRKYLTEVCKTVSKELDTLCTWFQVNKLSLNIAKTNFMVFGNKKCENNHLVSINGMYINRAYVTKCLGVHIDCHLNWNEHINRIKNKISKNVSVMYRIKHLLTSSALYSLYCTLILPYLNYCCEIWGNTYKSRIRPLHIIKKIAVRICLKADYRSHTRPMFYQLPANIILYFQKVNASHYHNIRMNNCNFKIRFSRTTKKAECINVKGPKM